MKAKPKILGYAALGLACTMLCIGLAACGGEPESRSIITAKPPESSYVPEDLPDADGGAPDSSAPEEEDTEPLPEDVPVTLSVAARLLTNQTNDNDGVFTLYTYLDGSADIQYIDFAGMTMSELSEPPKLETQNGRIPGCFGGVKPVAAAGRLFIFHLGGSPELVSEIGSSGYASVMRTNRDGSGLVTATFPEGYMFQLSSAVLFDGERLLFLMSDASGGTEEFVLMALNCETLEYQELHRLEDGYTYTLEGFWEKGPLICGATLLPPATDPGFTAARDDQQFHLFNMGLASGTLNHLASWGIGDTNYVNENQLYFWNADERAVGAIDADTGEGRFVAGGFAPDKYDHVYLQRSYVDGWLRIQFTLPGGKRNVYYSINAETGQVAQPPIDKLGENIIIYAELEEEFLVRYDEKWVNRSKLDPDLDPMTVNGGYNRDFVNMPEFAMISKSDYWAGRRNFRKIKDLIY